MTFNEKQSLYQPKGILKPSSLIVRNTTVYTDLTAQQRTVIKNIYTRDFILQDSLQKIKWKFTDEYRDIAGYEYRRANGVFLDSIYIVAFYTDQILPRIGPESFNGLPGTILGVALPHENVSWFAKSVIVPPTPLVVESPIKPDTKFYNNRADFLKHALEKGFLIYYFTDEYMRKQLDL